MPRKPPQLWQSTKTRQARRAPPPAPDTPGGLTWDEALHSIQALLAVAAIDLGFPDWPASASVPVVLRGRLTPSQRRGLARLAQVLLASCQEGAAG